MVAPLIAWGAVILVGKVAAALGAGWGAGKAAQVIAEKKVSNAGGRYSEASAGLQSTSDNANALIKSVQEEQRRIRDQLLTLSDPILAFYKEALDGLPQIAKPAELNETLSFDTPDLSNLRPDLQPIVRPKEDDSFLRSAHGNAFATKNPNDAAAALFIQAGKYFTRGVGSFIEAHKYSRDIDKFITECEYWKTDLRTKLILPIENFKNQVAETCALHQNYFNTIKPVFDASQPFDTLTEEQKLAVQYVYHTTKFLYQVTNLPFSHW